jgi:hypothetical protein
MTLANTEQLQTQNYLERQKSFGTWLKDILHTVTPIFTP